MGNWLAYAPNGKLKRTGAGKALVINTELSLVLSGITACGCVATYKLGDLDLAELNAAFTLAKSGCGWYLNSACNVYANAYPNNDCTGDPSERTYPVNLSVTYNAGTGLWEVLALALGSHNPFQDVGLFYGTAAAACPIIPGAISNEIACSDSGALAEGGTATLSWVCP